MARLDQTTLPNGPAYPSWLSSIERQPSIGSALVGSSGTWTMTGTVGLLTNGPAEVLALCATGVSVDLQHIDFMYPPTTVTISGAEPIVVSPTSRLRPGATVAVSAAHNLCSGIYSPTMNLWTTSRPAILVGGGRSISAEPDKPWSATMQIPDGLIPGEYEVEVDCTYPRYGYQGSYQPIDVHVDA
jgi:hypothetical protein